MGDLLKECTGQSKCTGRMWTRRPLTSHHHTVCELPGWFPDSPCRLLFLPPCGIAAGPSHWVGCAASLFMVLATPESNADLLREEVSRVGEGFGGWGKLPHSSLHFLPGPLAQHFQLGFLVAAVQSLPSVPGLNKGPFDEKYKSK